MKLSICIPTYNRATHLANCLNSVISCSLNSDLKFQVCVSDNHSTDDTERVVKNAQSFIDIKYQKNETNIGASRNFLKVVSMADNDFVWMIGDDDLLLVDSITRLNKILIEHPSVDFIYVNSFHLGTEYLNDFPSPFDINNLPNNMDRFSQFTEEREMPFFDLINPHVSFDFLGGIFLSVFRKKNWDDNVDALDKNAIHDNRIFSHFDNTFPHLKIYAKAFSTSKAYFNASPLNVCLTGAREWIPMGSLVMSIRLVEALKEYKRNGLPYLQYIYCKNYALNNCIPDFVNIIINKKISGYDYINLIQLSLEYCWYPNFYLSFFYFIGRRARKVLRHSFKYCTDKISLLLTFKM
jgi:glycosyltransferase involved in cell wall biosynthesis